MPGYAFQTQLFFLFQRERQVRGIAQPSMFGQGVVSDFMFAKDALFAQADPERRGVPALRADARSRSRRSCASPTS